MFNHILIPLDGSATAEVVLPIAAGLATTLGARTTLMHVIEADAAPSIHGERHLTHGEEAATYLSEIGRRFFPGGKVTIHVHMGAMKDVARGIVLHEAELAPDLIILCTHGRGGLRGLLFGRIAQQVADAGNLPVLLIRPEYHRADHSYVCRRMLVPTDATGRHSQGPDTAVELARILGAHLDLLTVVPTASALTGCQATARRFAPGATQVMLELEEADLQNRLHNLSEKCRGDGIPTDVHLKRGEPAAVIADSARELNVDMIVLGTHAKAGTKAFWDCSVGAGVLSRTFRPVLLVPAGQV